MMSEGAGPPPSLLTRMPLPAEEPPQSQPPVTVRQCVLRPTSSPPLPFLTPACKKGRAAEDAQPAHASRRLAAACWWLPAPAPADQNRHQQRPPTGDADELDAAAALLHVVRAADADAPLLAVRHLAAHHLRTAGWLVRTGASQQACPRHWPAWPACACGHSLLQVPAACCRTRQPLPPRPALHTARTRTRTTHLGVVAALQQHAGAVALRVAHADLAGVDHLHEEAAGCIPCSRGPQAAACSCQGRQQRAAAVCLGRGYMRAAPTHPTHPAVGAAQALQMKADAAVVGSHVAQGQRVRRAMGPQAAAAVLGAWPPQQQVADRDPKDAPRQAVHLQQGQARDAGPALAGEAGSGLAGRGSVGADGGVRDAEEGWRAAALVGCWPAAADLPLCMGCNEWSGHWPPPVGRGPSSWRGRARTHLSTVPPWWGPCWPLHAPHRCTPCLSRSTRPLLSG
jgi:hypothetical protein